MKKQIRIPMNGDYSQIHTIELEGFENIASGDDAGYLLLPRAAGCADYGLCHFSRHQEDFDITLRDLNMPLFGVKTDKSCYLAVASGMIWNFCLRIVCKNGVFSLYPGFEVHGEQPYEDYCLDIYELTGEDADYSGMARLYRNLRLDKGEIVPLKQRMPGNPILTYTAESVMIRIRCGWKPAPPQVLHQTLENEPPMHVACDFERVGDILDELKRQGVEKAEICLVGWNVKGHDGRWPQMFPVCEEAGGEEKLRALIRKAQDMGYQIVCHTNSTDQYEIAENFDIDNCLITRDNRLQLDAWSGGQMHSLCPKVSYEQALEILPKVADLGFRGTHYIDVLGVTPLRRCFHEKHPVSYPESREYARKLCELARQQFGGISSEGAYDFIAPWLDYGLYISFQEGDEKICDQPVPFWQMVYHGIVLSNPYACTVNATFKGSHERLKLVEYGGRPSYYFYSAFMGNGANWMGNTDCICDTQEQLQSSVAKIKEGYDLYTALADLTCAFMDKHEQVAEGVFDVTYSNGTVLRIDHQNMDWQILKSPKASQ